MNISLLCDELWDNAQPLMSEAWGSMDPQHPGHDPGEAARREFRGAQINERLLVLLKEEGDDLPEGVRLITNISNSAEEITKALQAEEYEGWNRTLNSPTQFQDQQHKLHLWAENNYTPLEGSDVTPRNLAGILGLNKGSLNYLQVDGGTASLFAIASKRTGVTTGQFVHDTNLEALLKSFRIEVLRRDVISANTVTNAAIDALWGNVVETRYTDQIDAMERQIRTKEREIAEIKERISLVKALKKS
ncbi:MAG: hypothetical protein EBR40_00140 [Proteobacteria bacterium]|nr:hypothetical protein [Pseudomonadota bacterium]